MKFFLRFLLLSLTFGFLFQGCVKREFDVPPIIDEASDLVANSTIAELKAKHTFGQAAAISEDIIIKGVVVSNDREGNFFKVLIIQDGTAGIEIQIDRVSLWEDYPVGREIFVKCQGLFMGDNNGTIQLGASIDASANNRVTRIPDVLRRAYLFRGARNQDASPTSVRISELNQSRISTLVRLEGVQFSSGDVGSTLADVVNQFSRNLTIEDCDGNRMIIRTSGFSTFAGAQAPSGRGTITGVYSVFGNDRQLFIRDLEDLKLDGDRCGSGGVGGNLISIANLRASFTGSTGTVADNLKIKGVVITDVANSNITARNLVLQEPNGSGITIRFDANNTFALGDEIEVNVSGVEISEFQGLLQLNNVPNSRASKVGTGTVSPRNLTIAEINAQFEALESTLVRIEGVTITKTSGTNFSGSCILDDGTGTITLFTQSYSAFAGNNFPTGVVTLTGIVSQGGTQQARQIFIRNLNDIVGGGSGGGDLTSLNEGFSGITNNSDLSLTGWRNIAEIGARVWRGQTFQGNGYAQATSFNSTDPVNVMWLITPEITIDQPKELLFETAVNFWVHNGLEVLVATNFNGNNLADANWTKLEARMATEGDTPQTFIPSGAVDLSAFTGKMHIAFKYTGNNTNSTSTYRVDNIVVRNK
jgi:hypothetical protein